MSIGEFGGYGSLFSFAMPPEAGEKIIGLTAAFCEAVHSVVPGTVPPLQVER
jgi:hypothetical protein